MQEQKLISVIVPSYNYAAYLPELFLSLQKQTFSAWECIVVDDGSRDNTLDLLREWEQKDARIKWIQQKNAGPAVARNTGLKQARGTFIQFIDADDFIGTEKFEREMQLFAENPDADIVYSGYAFVDEAHTKTWTDAAKWQDLSADPFADFVRYWEIGLMIPIHSFLFRKSCFERWGGMNEKLKTHEDWDLHLNFSLNKARYLYHNYCGAYYRIHLSSSSRTDLTRNREDTMETLLKYLHSDKTNALQKALIRKRYGRYAADFLVERLRNRNIRYWKTLKMPQAGFLAFRALVLLPLNLWRKTRKQQRR